MNVCLCAMMLVPVCVFCWQKRCNVGRYEKTRWQADFFYRETHDANTATKVDLFLRDKGKLNKAAF